MLNDFYDWFWSPRHWLPYNITWSDLEENSEVRYAKQDDLKSAVLMITLALLVTRILLERFCFEPIGIYFGIKHGRRKLNKPQHELENLYKTNTKTKENVKEVGRKLNMSERQIERWFRIRKSQDKQTKMKKFTETCFRCFYYSLSFCLGLYTLWDKPWLWDIDQCWYNFPQAVTNDIMWYYRISLGFYCSLTVTQFTDIRHKDFWQMFIHHFVTIFLLSLSWICNFHRIGTLVLVLHDCADVFLEGSKIAKYINKMAACHVIFALFTVTWVVTRIGLFPFWILKSTSINSQAFATLYPAYFIFNGMLFMLLALHIFWTYLIAKIIVKALSVGTVEGDIRSSSSEEWTDEFAESQKEK